MKRMQKLVTRVCVCKWSIRRGRNNASSQGIDLINSLHYPSFLLKKFLTLVQFLMSILGEIYYYLTLNTCSNKHTPCLYKPTMRLLSNGTKCSFKHSPCSVSTLLCPYLFASFESPKLCHSIPFASSSSPSIMHDME